MTDRFIKTFEASWRDLDLNMHVANTTYGEFGNDTRMAYYHSKGIDMAWFTQHMIGPILFREAFHYQREFLRGDKVFVELLQKGSSEDGRFMELALPMYNEKGEIGVYSEAFIAWIDLDKRKLAVPPPFLHEALKAIPKSDDFSILTKADTRLAGIIPDRTLDAETLAKLSK